MKTSLSKQALIYNLPIKVYINGIDYINVNIPSMKELLTNMELAELIDIVSTPLEVLASQPEMTGFIFTTYSGFFVALYHTNARMANLTELLFENTTLSKKGLLYKDAAIDIPEQVLWYIVHVLKVGLGEMSYEDFLKEENLLGETEDQKKMRENEEKIKRVRDKKPREQESNSGLSHTVEDGIITILAMLPSFSLEEISHLNRYGFEWFYSKATSLVYDRISAIAAGNGLLPKGKSYNFITENSK